MRTVAPLLTVVALCAVAWVGVAAFDLRVVFGVAVPCVGGLAFLGGFVVKVLEWARSPIPFPAFRSPADSSAPCRG